MGKSIHVAAYPGGLASTATTSAQYYAYIGGINASTTEANANLTIYSAGTLSLLSVNLISNGIAAISTFRLRKNSANGNQVISIAASTAGVFRDTTNNDAVVANDIVDVSFVAGSATGTILPCAITSLFDATTDTVTKLAYNHTTLNNSAYGGTGSVYFIPVHGYMPPTGSTTVLTEGPAQSVVGGVGTFRNMSMNLTTNSRAVVDTLRFRKNGANGNQVVSTTASTAGIYRDTTHTDTVVAGDKVNYSLTNGSATTVKTLAYFASEFISVSPANPALSHYSTAAVTATLPTQPKATTQYYAIAGRCIGNNTENNAYIKTPDDFTFAYLAIIVNANPITSASTLTFRKNSTNTSLTLSITASTAGTYTDTTNTAATVAGDLVDYALVAGANATAVNITVTSMSTIGQYTTAAIDMTPNLVTIRNKIITKI